MEKSKLNNKMEKSVIENKEVKETKHDFSSLGAEVQITAIGRQKHMKEGETYTCGKQTAIQLINRGLAKLA